VLLFFEDLPIHMARGLELTAVLARHGPAFFLTMIINFFFIVAVLSAAEQIPKTLLSFSLLFFFSQTVYRSIERVDGCRRQNDTAVSDAVDIVAACLVLNGTPRVHVYGLPLELDGLTRRGYLLWLAHVSRSGIYERSNTPLHGRSGGSLEKFVRQISHLRGNDSVSFSSNGKRKKLNK